MLEQAADVVQCGLAQQRVAVRVVEQVLAVLAERLMHVHPAAIVPEHGLGHESERLTRRPRKVLEHILVHHHLVGHPAQVLEPHAYLALACGGDLVVVHLALDASLHELDHRAGAEVLQGIGRRHREVPLLVPWPVTVVDPVDVVAGVPYALVGVDVIEAGIAVLIEPHRVEHEELQLRTHIGGVGDARAPKMLFGLLRYVPRVPLVPLPLDRLPHIAGDGQRRNAAGGVEDRRGHVRS